MNFHEILHLINIYYILFVRERKKDVIGESSLYCKCISNRNQPLLTAAFINYFYFLSQFVFKKIIKLTHYFLQPSEHIQLETLFHQERTVMLTGRTKNNKSY